MDDAMMETIRANARYYRLANGMSGTYIGEAIGHDAAVQSRSNPKAETG